MNLLIPLIQLPILPQIGTPLQYTNKAIPHVTGSGTVVAPHPSYTEDLDILIPWWAILRGQDAGQQALNRLAPGFGAASEGVGYRRDARHVLSLDLNPPEPVENRSGRLDGLPIAAAALARAHGLDPTNGVIWDRVDRFEWSLRVPLPGGRPRVLPGLDTFERRFVREKPAHQPWVQGTANLYVAVPSLAEVDPEHEHTDRLALIAVYAARYAEKP